ncbi:MAG: hypothetical protein AAGN82_29685 [Myxococcota bacterium]
MEGCRGGARDAFPPGDDDPALAGVAQRVEGWTSRGDIVGAAAYLDEVEATFPEDPIGAEAALWAADLRLRSGMVPDLEPLQRRYGIRHPWRVRRLWLASAEVLLERTEPRRALRAIQRARRMNHPCLADLDFLGLRLVARAFGLRGHADEQRAAWRTTVATWRRRRDAIEDAIEATTALSPLGLDCRMQSVYAAVADAHLGLGNVHRSHGDAIFSHPLFRQADKETSAALLETAHDEYQRAENHYLAVAVGSFDARPQVIQLMGATEATGLMWERWNDELVRHVATFFPPPPRIVGAPFTCPLRDIEPSKRSYRTCVQIAAEFMVDPDRARRCGERLRALGDWWWGLEEYGEFRPPGNRPSPTRIRTAPLPR